MGKRDTNISEANLQRRPSVEVFVGKMVRKEREGTRTGSSAWNTLPIDSVRQEKGHCGHGAECCSVFVAQNFARLCEYLKLPHIAQPMHNLCAIPCIWWSLCNAEGARALCFRHVPAPKAPGTFVLLAIVSSGCPGAGTLYVHHTSAIAAPNFFPC